MARSFGEGFASGFTSTFSALEAAEARKKADERAERALKLQEEDAGRRKSEFERVNNERQALRSAISEAPTGDQVQVPTMVGMTGSYDEQDAPMRTEAISPEQRRTNFRQRAVALGADPLAVQQYEAGDLQLQTGQLALKKGGLEVGKLEREADFDKRFQGVMDGIHKESATRLKDIDTTAQVGGMKGLVDKFGPELKKALGADVQLVGNNIVVKAKGQKPQTITSVEQAVQALQGAAQMEFTNSLEKRMISEGLFKSPQEIIAYFRNQREDARKERDTDSVIALRADQGTQARAAAGYYNRGGASANRQTAGDQLNERISAYASVMMRADPNLSKADAEKRAAQVILRDPEAKPDMTPADVNNFLEKQAGTVIRVDPNTKKPVRLGDLPLDEQVQIARQTLGRGGVPAAPGGGLPDVDPKAMQRPGAAPAAPAAPGGGAQPQSAIPLTQRLSAAIGADNQAGNRNRFTTLATEVERTLPGIQSQITQLEKALPLARSAEERANIQARIDELAADLPIMQGILGQRRAALGY